VNAGREVSTVHQKQTGVDLSNGQITSTMRRNLRGFPLPVCFHNFKSAANSRTMRAGQLMSTRNDFQSGVGLSFGQVTPAGWRHLPPIPVSGPFSRLVKALITRKRQELGDECLHNTNSKSKSTYQTVKLLPLGVAICRRFSLPVCGIPLITRTE
jgi:hypothetical protein